MKLRMKNNSLRLRLTQSETARFAETGKVEEAIEFGGEKFVYSLETKTDAAEISAVFENGRITVFVPETEAAEWRNTEKVGIENELQIGGEKTLRIQIEKDFACLASRPGEDESDAFPNPHESKTC